MQAHSVPLEEFAIHIYEMVWGSGGDFTIDDVIEALNRRRGWRGLSIARPVNPQARLRRRLYCTRPVEKNTS